MSPMYCNAGNGDDSAIAAADRNGVLLYDVSGDFWFSVFGGGSEVVLCAKKV
jgi:hypothetical protein